MEGLEIHATKDQILELKESVIWKDIVDELNMWKLGCNNEMLSIVGDAEDNNPSTATVLMHLGDLNGRIKAVEYMINILDVFLSFKEVKEDDTRPE